jgi:hypothetical protein
MALIKTRARGLKLDDNFSFTGTITGAGGGKLLQVQSTESNGRTTISSGSFTSINGLEDTITPSATTSKILVLVNGQFGADSNNASVTYVGAKFKLYRNHSGISETEIFSTHYQHNRPENSGMDMIFQNNLNFIYLDSPNTTNEVTYTTKGLNDPSTSGLEVIAGGSNDFDKTITLIEIGA